MKMDDIFLVLLLFALLFLVLSLINPRWIRFKTRGKAASVFLSLVVVCFVGFGVTYDGKKTDASPSVAMRDDVSAPQQEDPVAQHDDVSASQQEEPEPIEHQPSETGSRNWYEGGTLHDATVAEWLDAQEVNRLATASDWTVALIGREKTLALGDMSIVKKLATGLMVCIDTTVKGDVVPGDAKANEIAMMCAITMKWPLKKK
jgi:hypothetical protein